MVGVTQHDSSLMIVDSIVRWQYRGLGRYGNEVEIALHAQCGERDLVRGGVLLHEGWSDGVEGCMSGNLVMSLVQMRD